MKKSALKWYGHVIRMNVCDFPKRIYECMIKGRGIRGTQPVKWINIVEEYWRERTGRRGLGCGENA